MVPHLITALTRPINEFGAAHPGLYACSLSVGSAWSGWKHTPPFYSSVDIRNAGFSWRLVDTNLFPGDGITCTPETLPLAVQAAMAAIEKIRPEARNLLIIPE